MCGFVGFLALTNESAPTEAWISTLIDTIPEYATSASSCSATRRRKNACSFGHHQPR